MTTYIRARCSTAADSASITLAAVERIGHRLLLLHQAKTTLGRCALELCSDKGEDDWGGHGEGLKSAALEAYRNGYEVMLLHNQEAWMFRYHNHTYIPNCK
jgi:hypothetical protein